MSGDNGLKSSEKTAVYHQLAERAWNRFESHRRVEWRTFFGLWTALGIGIVAAVTSDSWTTGWTEAGVSLLIAVVVLAACFQWWIPYISKSLYRDNWISYYWETHLIKSVGSELPKAMQPPGYGGDTWPSAFDTDPNNVCGKEDGEVRKLPETQHTAQKLQFGVTVLFCFLFVGAMASKAWRHDVQHKSTATMTIDGGTLEVDGTSQFKLGK